jgi:antitoxin (DNA-binding transcriptional repressor) of toxin-antitoxin stability system
MTDETITVTEAARNFADCINRTHYQNKTFVLLKNGVPFARLVPAGEPICLGKDLVDALAGVKFSRQTARAWHRDLKASRKRLKTPPDKWQ